MRAVRFSSWPLLECSAPKLLAVGCHKALIRCLWSNRRLKLWCLVITAAAVLLLRLQEIQRVHQLRPAKKLLEIDQLRPTAQLLGKLADFRVPEISCMSLISGNQSELQRALGISAHWPAGESDSRYSNATCADHLSRLVTSSLSEEERQFPLAFSIMVYKDFDQVLRLLRAIYRPEHCYCIHVDAKASWWFRTAVAAFARCLENVLIAEPSVSVKWSRYSVLEAELTCWRLLLSKFSSWKYLINLTGQEFPLRTMREVIGILKQLRGTNSIENAGPITSYKPHQLAASSVGNHSGGRSQLVWHKGSVHVLVCRGFVDFVFGPVGLALQQDLREQDTALQRDPPTDEVLFATLNYNAAVLRVPGAPLDDKLTTDNVRLPFLPRFKNWLSGPHGYPCLLGRVVHGICIWGLADLPAMNGRFELFANKFHADFQPLALRCMEERFWHNTLADYGLMGLRRSWEIDLASYSNYSHVRS